MARIAISNMNCGGCAKGVTSAVQEAEPSAQVEVDLDRKQLTITGISNDGRSLIAALQAAGWKAQIVAA